MVVKDHRSLWRPIVEIARPTGRGKPRRPRCHRADRDRALGETGDGRCSRNCRGRSDIASASERNVVAGDIVGIGNKAGSSGHDLSLVRSQSRAGVALRYALETMDSVGGIGEQSAAHELVVEPCTKYSALARGEGSAVFLVVLDLSDEGRNFGGR